MTESADERDALLTGYALHALDRDDEQRAERLIAENPSARARLEELQSTASMLAEVTPDVPPPPTLRSVLLEKIAETPQDAAEVDAVDVESLSPRPSRPARRGWFALAAGIALVVGLGGGAVAINSLNAANAPDTVALRQIEASSDAAEQSAGVTGGGAITVHWSDTTGQVVVVSDGLPSLDEGKQYQFWLVRGDEPIPAGVADGGAASQQSLLEGDFEPGDVVAITVEDAGGSPTGAPTTTPLVTVAT